jgi:hypothetical protein
MPLTDLHESIVLQQVGEHCLTVDSALPPSAHFKVILSEVFSLVTVHIFFDQIEEKQQHIRFPVEL